jgi:hypothetical protein
MKTAKVIEISVAQFKRHCEICNKTVILPCFIKGKNLLIITTMAFCSSTCCETYFRKADLTKTTVN